MLIPATLFMGITVFQDKKYYLICMLIILYTFLSFALVFEKRRPQARELMIIAVMSAIAVAGCAAFFWLPQFKPVLAIVVLTGVSFGAQAGFLTGAVTAFSINILLGQGPWTPWQMFALGLVGFIAGLLFKPGRLPRTNIVLAIYGGAATVCIYGLIMNFSSIALWSRDFSWGNILTIYAGGVPFDLLYAAATMVFMLLISKTMLEKLQRVKEKYGLTEISGENTEI